MARYATVDDIIGGRAVPSGRLPPLSDRSASVRSATHEVAKEFIEGVQTDIDSLEGAGEDHIRRMFASSRKRLDEKEQAVIWGMRNMTPGQKVATRDFWMEADSFFQDVLGWLANIVDRVVDF